MFILFNLIDSYDVVILCGALVPGHVTPDCLIEFTRIAKSGKYLNE